MIRPKFSDLPTRFWDKVEPNEDGCWIWTAGVRRRYGSFFLHGVTRVAHRLAAEDALGPIPAGGYVLHTCDTPLCQNRDHLYYGDHAQNMRDMVARGRWDGGGRKGEGNNASKLTEELVRKARRMYATGNYSLRELSRQFPVSEKNFRIMVQGKTWSHVQPADSRQA